MFSVSQTRTAFLEEILKCQAASSKPRCGKGIKESFLPFCPQIIDCSEPRLVRASILLLTCWTSNEGGGIISLFGSAFAKGYLFRLSLFQSIFFAATRVLLKENLAVCSNKNYLTHKYILSTKYCSRLCKSSVVSHCFWDKVQSLQQATQSSSVAPGLCKPMLKELPFPKFIMVFHDLPLYML